MKREISEDPITRTDPPISLAPIFPKTQKFLPQRRRKSTPPPPQLSGATTNDGASVEIIHRRRGRPPGSKNKLKPTLIITQDTTAPSMSAFVLEIPAGSDIIDSVYIFCRRRNSGFCVLNGSGAVANVTIKQPSVTPGATVTFHGRFDILSLSGTVLIQQYSANQIGNGFTISLAGPQGHVVGGAVVPPLVAAATVYLIAASFNNPSYHLLPAEDDDQVAGNNDRGSSPSGVSGGGVESGHVPPEECGKSVYSCHVPPSDVAWAPTARPPY